MLGYIELVITWLSVMIHWANYGAILGYTELSVMLYWAKCNAILGSNYGANYGAILGYTELY